MLSMRPQVGVWLREATEFQLAVGWTRGSLRALGVTEARDNRLSVSGIPDVTGHHGGAENKMGALRGGLSHPQDRRDERAGREGR